MGGYGSGRRRTNQAVGSFYKLDVRKLQRDGALLKSASAVLQWAHGGRIAAHAHFESTGVALTVNYGLLGLHGRWSHFKHHLALAWTSCHYGGSRAWFICPGLGCGRRVATLFGREDFACRHCRKISYDCQRIAPLSRAMARAQTIRTRLGGSPDLSLPFPPRPKGMHEWTYTKLALSGLAAEIRANAAIGQWVDSVTQRRERAL